MAANDMRAMFLATLAPQVEAANALAARITAATGDNKSLVHDIRDNPNTDDAKVREFQEWLAKVDAAREQNIKEIGEYITANLLPKTDESFDVEKAKAEHADLRKSIAAGKTYAKTVGVTDEDIATLPDLKNLRGGTSTAGANGSAEGVKRPRISAITVNGESVSAPKKNDDGTVTDVVSFTVLATYLTKQAGVKVEPSLIRDAVFEAAKTDDLSTVKGETFSVSETVNGKTFEVTVTV